MKRVQFSADHVPRDHSPAGTPGDPKRKRYPRYTFRCPHSLQVWTWGAHPRYGTKVPFCTPSQIPDPHCGC